MIVWLMLAMALGGLGLTIAVLGGFMLGRWWQERFDDLYRVLPYLFAPEAKESNRIYAPNDSPDLSHLIHRDQRRGRIAISSILSELRQQGQFYAVVVSDDSGLVVSSSGPSQTVEGIAAQAASFGASQLLYQPWFSLVCTQPNGDWIMHRYFSVEESMLCMSWAGFGSFPSSSQIESMVNIAVELLYMPSSS